MHYSAVHIAQVLACPSELAEPQRSIRSISTDSRRIRSGSDTLFVALPGPSRSGADYINDAYARGCRTFLTTEVLPDLPDANWLLHADPLEALQQLATAHRRSLAHLPTIAITGSNGKTIVKEWLATLLGTERQVCKSPKSYNSQIGVPLSVLLADESDEVAIFEAGISQPGEMSRLTDIIQPHVGILTNIGDAHDAGFASREQKLEEKCLLFEQVEVLIYCRDQTYVDEYVSEHFDSDLLTTWSLHGRTADYQMTHSDASLAIQEAGKIWSVPCAMKSPAMVQNLCHAIVAARVSGIATSHIAIACEHDIGHLSMRLEVEEGINGCLLLNDAYNADLTSLRIALDTQQDLVDDRSKTLIVSNFDDNSKDAQATAAEIAGLIADYDIQRTIAVGPGPWPTGESRDILTFPTTEDLIAALPQLSFGHEAILVKGARRFALERVVDRLSLYSHSATLQIDLAAIGHNLNVYRSLVEPDTALMAIIKASAYGTGSVDVAKYLEQRGIDYFGVAFPDEGILLREQGIRTPILVLNPDMGRVDDYLKYDLEIELYSLDQLPILSACLAGGTEVIKLHIKVDTGMHRLGLSAEDVGGLRAWLSEWRDRVAVVGLFSHLASSEDAEADSFSLAQRAVYEQWVSWLPEARFRHLLNTAGIVRFPQWQYDMVRLGLGLYGIDSTGQIADQLEQAHRLTAQVMQVRTLRAGEAVGYNQRYRSTGEETIVVVNIGYADGLLRASGQERYALLHRGELIPIIGNVCMDLTICRIDHDLGVAVGDEVVIFGPEHPIVNLAQINGTIPYEILSRIAPRVRRRYIMA